MSLTDWIVSISAAALGIMISIAAYFAQKWIQTVDETLKEHSHDFKDVSKQISSLQQSQNNQAENISKAIHAQIATARLPYATIDNTAKEVSLIKQVVQEKLLPQSEHIKENFGRIFLIENSLREQDQKMITMFNVLKVLVNQSKK